MSVTSLLLFLFLLSGSRIFLLSVSRNAPWTTHWVTCYCCSSCSPVSSPSKLSQWGVHCPCISHGARCLALLYQLHPPVLTPPQSVPCCSQLFSCLPNFFLYSPQLLLFFSLVLCSFSPSSLLSHAASGWFHPLFHWTMTLCCFFHSLIFPLPHLLVYLLSSPSWLHSPSSHPFWCVSPGWHIL